ncbi:hypothetical protein NXX34_05630 [Bacteroides fragilis]|nr:hypothetical protein [Bacteroides fragilis]
METIITTAGKTATNDNSVANAKAVRTISLKQQLAKAEKDLKNMVNRKVDDTVLRAQEQIVEQLKQAITEKNSKKEAPALTLKDEPITFQLAKTGEKVSKKIAFVKHNRTVNTKKVDEFIAIIANDKYEDAYPIIVVEAKELIKRGYTVTDVNGRALTEEEAEGYFVILDGQHRSTAFAKLNSVSGDIIIPNVFVKDVKNVGSYLEEINRVGNWDMRAKIGVAALTSKDELFENMAELIQQGFNPTTAGLIYTKKNIPEKTLNKVLKEEEYKLPKDAIVNIKRGNDFITLCKAANISVTFLTKRYFIKGFNSYAKVHGEEQAFKALDKLKQLELTDEKLKQVKEDDDFQVMLQNALEA